MKKYILTAVTVFVFALTNAQKVNFGAKAGLNVANLTGYFPDSSPLIGFNAGIFTEIKITDKFAVQPELLFSTQGNKMKIPVLDASSVFLYSYDGKWNLSYLNLPVMAKYYILDKLSIEAGPQIGLLLSAKAKYSSDRALPSLNTSTSEYDIKNYLKSIDLGLNFGAVYDVSKNLSVNFRYNLGLANINNEPMSSSNIKNKVFSLSLGYKH
ncbi:MULTISPECIES: porin family protein [Flavobacterium]|uniref:PorT family protein n=1 Tax=Flavobacterium gawalongense TaxID=2594432 RepID=A0A553BVB0_9FLAO|nr:porin family protein [Flavobacterium gawalongense]TRW97961.1 PorT family protein [Flavobacterium gawalongense]TRX02345.1 PorT family protein [Flavobacterium gawalongense]TRX10943.1 PorT family protein [Flavobacterium gawalongense]TRX12189.1 PorT family protein [Flavobacterium gawalongense]TRX25143.1 PorT family protein [Flavobacterium gawalongense]